MAYSKLLEVPVDEEGTLISTGVFGKDEYIYSLHLKSGKTGNAAFTVTQPSLPFTRPTKVHIKGWLLDSTILVEEMTALSSEGVKAAPPATGAATILLVLLEFPDQLGAPASASACTTLLNSVKSFFSDNSFGQLTITPTTTPTLTMPSPTTTYGGGGTLSGFKQNQIVSDATPLLTDAGYTLTDYDFPVFYTKLTVENTAGLGNIGAPNVWIFDQGFEPHVVEHEMGHNLGLFHANSWANTDPKSFGPYPYNHHEYGDEIGLMGSGFRGSQFSAWDKYEIGWLTADQFPLVSPPSPLVNETEETYTLAVAERSTAPPEGSVLGLCVAYNSTIKLSVEYRDGLTRLYLLAVVQPYGNKGTYLFFTDPNEQTSLLNSGVPLYQEWCAHGVVPALCVAFAGWANAEKTLVDVRVRWPLEAPSYDLGEAGTRPLPTAVPTRLWTMIDPAEAMSLVYILVGVVGGGVVIIFVVTTIGYFACCRQKKKDTSPPRAQAEMAMR